MIETLNFVAAFPALILTALVVRAYLPAAIPGYQSFNWLALAIVLSFFSVGGAILVWDILTYVPVLDEWRLVWGRSFNFLNREILGGLAAYLHLVAIHQKLDLTERARWSPLEMAWYPKRRTCLRRLFGRSGSSS